MQLIVIVLVVLLPTQRGIVYQPRATPWVDVEEKNKP